MKTIRTFEAFAGYGSQLMALRRLEMAYPDQLRVDPVGIAEIDKYALQAYHAVHGDVTNYGDITKIDWAKVPDFDLFTYSSPCQDFSQAGRQAGGERGSGTRSSLLWECERSIREKRPKWLLMENVAALVGKKFIKLFNQWQLTLERMGYSNFCMVMNAKNYGVPQNRERIFMVSILDENARYEFPRPFPLEKRLRDVLEEQVDEKYYLSNRLIDCFETRNIIAKEKGNGFRFEPTDDNTVASSITTHAGSRPDDNYIKEPVVLGWSRSPSGEVVNRHKVQVANCVTSAKRDNAQNYVLESINIDREGNARTINAHYEDMNVESAMSQPRDGFGYVRTAVVESPIHRLHQQDAVQHEDGISRCLVVGSHGNSNDYTKTAVSNGNGYRIRKLTPRECFRLMDVDETDIDKIQAAGISNSQQYKMAGNSIVVSCLYHIFDKLFIHTEIINKTLFD